MQKSALNTVTSYALHDKILTYKKLLELDNDDLNASILRVYPLFTEHFGEICDLIYSIPEQENEIAIISKPQKEFYVRSMKLRIEQLLKPKCQAMKVEV